MTNVLYHHYELDETVFIFKGIGSEFKFLLHFSMKFLQANRIAPDVTPCSAASHLGVYCLPKSHRKEARAGLFELTSWIVQSSKIQS